MEEKKELLNPVDLKEINFDEKTLFSAANDILDSMLDFKELMLEYSSAIREIKTKFLILDQEFQVRNDRNPISNIQTRLKSQVSIMQKLERKGIGISREEVQENIRDIAGIRVICSYVDDIYRLAEALIKQTDIELVERKDYIMNPKPNGYRSLHLIVRVPVFFEESVRKVYAEVQIRTISMDFWASLEHQMKYKKKISNPEEISAKLKRCAEVNAYTDMMMLEIRKEMDGIEDEKSDVDQLLDKVKRFGISLTE